MRWPWTAAKEVKANEHGKEIADVQKRLDAVEERVDVIDEYLGVLQRNGEDS